jgi:hypothetical protein
MHDEDAATDPVEIAPWSQRLHDGPANRAFAAQQLMRQHAVIERTADYTIFRTGEAEGWILLYDMRSQEIGYAVGYRTCRWPWMNRPVTQCIVWRYPATCHVLAMTRRIFFGYLPQSFGTIMSDSRDEPSGYDFWVARMSAAIGLNLRVGVADMNVPALDWFDPAGNLCFEAWIRQRNGYGPTRNQQAIRYLISAL